MARLTLLMAGALLWPSALFAQAFDYLGAWRIVSSGPAPWATSNMEPDPLDLRNLSGKTVTFTARSIAAPPPLGCKGPNYEFKDYPPDMLFQGTLSDPIPQAKALGYRGATIRTLETGCDGAIDFHFVNAKTMLFALNNRIYRMERIGK